MASFSQKSHNAVSPENIAGYLLQWHDAMLISRVSELPPADIENTRGLVVSAICGASNQVQDSTASPLQDARFGRKINDPSHDGPSELGNSFHEYALSYQQQNEHAQIFGRATRAYDVNEGDVADLAGAPLLNSFTVYGKNTSVPMGPGLSMDAMYHTYPGQYDASTAMAAPLDEFFNFSAFNDHPLTTAEASEVPPFSHASVGMMAGPTPSYPALAFGSAYAPIVPAATLGMSALPPSRGPTMGGPASRAAGQTGVTCAICFRTFRRPGDCRRHEAKHQDSEFGCMVATCEKRFYRFDKARDHLRKGHGIVL